MNADEIKRGWERVRNAVTDNYVSDEGWEAIEAFDKLVDDLSVPDDRPMRGPMAWERARG